jgi:hypothetical protein
LASVVGSQGCHRAFRGVGGTVPCPASVIDKEDPPGSFQAVSACSLSCVGRCGPGGWHPHGMSTVVLPRAANRRGGRPGIRHIAPTPAASHPRRSGPRSRAWYRPETGSEVALTYPRHPPAGIGRSLQARKCAAASVVPLPARLFPHFMWKTAPAVPPSPPQGGRGRHPMAPDYRHDRPTQGH